MVIDDQELHGAIVNTISSLHKIDLNA
jgi:hypothetical protein